MTLDNFDMKRSVAIIVATAALLVGGAASAHTVWLVKDTTANVWLLRFGGHQGKLEPAMPAKLKTVTARDARGRSLRVARTVAGSDVRVAVTGEPSLIALYYDNGIHTRPPQPGPTIERPMNEVPGATSATSAVKYGKTIVRWGGIVTRPINQPFEVIPQGAAVPVAGQPMRVQVRLNRLPAAGVKIGRGEDTADGITDANGIASFTPVAGSNRLWAGKRIAVHGNPRYTSFHMNIF